MPIDLNEHLRQKNKNYHNPNEDNSSNNGGGNGGNNRNRGFQAPKMPNFSMPNAKKIYRCYK